MAQKTIAGQAVDVNDEGYLLDASQWSREIAAEMAKEDGIDLTDKHYEVLEFLRNMHNQTQSRNIHQINQNHSQHN